MSSGLSALSSKIAQCKRVGTCSLPSTQSSLFLTHEWQVSHKFGRGLLTYPPWGHKPLLCIGVCRETLCLRTLLLRCLWLTWEQCLGWDPPAAWVANLLVSAVCSRLASVRRAALGWVPAAWHRPLPGWQ